MVYGVWWVYGGWITTVVIIRPSQPSLAGVGAGAELANNSTLNEGAYTYGSHKKMSQKSGTSQTGDGSGGRGSVPK